MSAVDRNPIAGATLRDVVLVVISSVILSVCATVAALALLRSDSSDDPRTCAVAQNQQQPSQSSPAVDGRRVEEAHAEILKLRQERVRLARTVEEQATEIDRLKRLVEETQAQSRKIATVDPGQKKASALKTLTATKPDKAQLEIHAAVRDLVRLGDSIVPDVVALLKSGVSHSYGGGIVISGGSVGIYADDRMAMIDVLRKIGTPAARRGLLEAVGASDSLADYRNLFMLCSKTEDEEMARGMTALLPRIFRQLASCEGDDRTGWMLENHLAGWIRQHEVREALPGLAEWVENRGHDYRGPNELNTALVALSPEQAAVVACRMAAKEDGMAALERFAATHSFRDIPLANVARFYERLFSSVTLPPEVRMKIFARMPTRPPRDIEGIAARAADAKRLQSFLDSQLALEADPRTRKILEGHIERLREEIDRAEPK